MRLRIVLPALALLLLSACGNDEIDVGNGPDELIGRTFIAQTVKGHDLVDGTEFRLTFDANQITAHAGCNHLMGDLTSLDNGVLTVAGMGMTEMGCDPARHEQDTWLADFLGSSPAWALDGDELHLSNDSAELVLLDREVADADRPLEGTRWKVDSVITAGGPDGSVSSVPPEADAHIVFDKGQFEGSPGCNSMWGRYTIDDGHIAITEVAVTAAGCLDPGKANLEEQVSAVLSGRLAYEIVAGRLTLTAPDGTGLGFHADE